MISRSNHKPQTNANHMTKIAAFVFNMFQENTYVVYDETLQCAIVDPGCHNEQEQDALLNFFTAEKLQPVLLLNTHCHVDHIMGNNFVFEKFGIKPRLHQDELPILVNAPRYAGMFGVSIIPSPYSENFIKEGEIIQFGNTELEVLFTPGHSPGEVSFYCREEKFLLAGDVLFQQSIGRTDLPGGDYDTLIESIKNKLLPLGDEVKVYSGHGPATTIGAEIRSNPFLVE